MRRLGFVQADPIRAPARAQDLTLRHRVTGYRAGDLERRYAALGIEEDVFVNYGFVSRRRPGADASARRAVALADGARQGGRGAARVRPRARRVHPREVDAHFAHGSVTNYWGGSSNATTHLLDAMHYRGLLRVVRRERRHPRLRGRSDHDPGRATPTARRARSTRWSTSSSRKYAPLPGASLSWLVDRLRYAVPQWQRRAEGARCTRARRGLRTRAWTASDWYWPADERPAAGAAPDDTCGCWRRSIPIVWDRRRFELLWGWAYRFEAYTPATKRKLGYYALPLLWRDAVIGWANVSAKDGLLDISCGYVAGSAPKGRAFAQAMERERARLTRFLNG